MSSDKKELIDEEKFHDQLKTSPHFAVWIKIPPTAAQNYPPLNYTALQIYLDGSLLTDDIYPELFDEPCINAIDTIKMALVFLTEKNRPFSNYLQKYTHQLAMSCLSGKFFEEYPSSAPINQKNNLLYLAYCYLFFYRKNGLLDLDAEHLIQDYEAKYSMSIFDPEQAVSNAVLKLSEISSIVESERKRNDKIVLKPDWILNETKEHSSWLISTFLRLLNNKSPEKDFFDFFDQVEKTFIPQNASIEAILADVKPTYYIAWLGPKSSSIASCPQDKGISGFDLPCVNLIFTFLFVIYKSLLYNAHNHSIYADKLFQEKLLQVINQLLQSQVLKYNDIPNIFLGSPLRKFEIEYFDQSAKLISAYVIRRVSPILKYMLVLYDETLTTQSVTWQAEIHEFKKTTKPIVYAQSISDRYFITVNENEVPIRHFFSVLDEQPLGQIALPFITDPLARALLDRAHERSIQPPTRKQISLGTIKKLAHKWMEKTRCLKHRFNESEVAFFSHKKKKPYVNTEETNLMLKILPKI